MTTERRVPFDLDVDLVFEGDHVLVDGRWQRVVAFRSVGGTTTLDFGDLGSLTLPARSSIIVDWNDLHPWNDRREVTV